MPAYSFECAKCETQWKDICREGESSECPNCETITYASLPSSGASMVMETADKARGVKLRKNQTRQIKERMNKHHDQYEVADKIDQYGMKDAEKFQWTKKIKKM